MYKIIRVMKTAFLKPNKNMNKINFNYNNSNNNNNKTLNIYSKNYLLPQIKTIIKINSIKIARKIIHLLKF